MRAPLLLLLVVTAPPLAAAEGFTGRFAGILESLDVPCAAPAAGTLAYGRRDENGTALTLAFDAAGCGLPARTTFPWCGEGDEPGVMAAYHVWCRASLEPDAPSVWLQPDGYVDAAWASVILSGAWVHERDARLPGQG